MIYALPVEEMPKIRCKTEQQNLIGISAAAVKQLNLLY